MSVAPGQLELGGEQLSAAAARRSGRILCIVLLVLGVVDAGRFLFNDMAELAETARESRANLLTLQSASIVDGPQLEAAARQANSDDEAMLRGWGRLGGYSAAFLVIGFFLFHQLKRSFTRTQVVNAVTLMILMVGVALLASRLALQRAIPNSAAWGIGDLVALHVVASFIMAWTPKESVVPFVPLLLVWAVTFLVPNANDLVLIDRVVGVIVSPAALAPGAAIAAWRTRHRAEHAERVMLGQRVESMGGELSRARIVHDAMFPQPFTGAIAFEFVYEPIQEIGGDYVHTYVCTETGRVTMTLLDVAGHGLAAALTVNRLFGELERILAENTAAEPAEVMILLNRYINLTMAPHSLYATGACMRLDPSNGELKWVNAGHPPALLRRMSGQLTEMPTTSVLMGVLEPDEFEPNQQQLELRPGEVVIAYTDGAFEARDADGRRFGLDRIRQTACFDPPPRSWPKFIANAVAKHHDGHADDDVLIAALTLRSLRVAEPEPGFAPDTARAEAEI